MKKFSLGGISDHPMGWGPPTAAIEPKELKSLQFMPFNKADKLGRISDWNQPQNNPRRHQQQFSSGANVFNYKHQDDESSFALVDNTPKPKVRKGRRKYFQQPRSRRLNTRNRGRPSTSQRGGRVGQARRQSKRRQRFNYGRRRTHRTQDEGKKEPSVEVDPNWKVVSTIDLQSLKVGLTVDKGETLVRCGKIQEWDVACERVNPRAPMDLRTFNDVQVFTTTTSEDPVIGELADSNKANIFITDTIAAVLMCAPYSSHSFDVIATKKDGKIFFDKRMNSRMDYLTVNENWNESKETERDSMNHTIRLSEEATYINHNFINQVIKGPGTAMDMERKNPFLDALQPPNKPAPIAFFYRRWNLGGDRDVVIRCEINGYETRKGQKQYFISRAINEWNSKLSGNIDYKLKLESQSGAVLAAEMKNNLNKLAKWTTKALISDADHLKLGYVTRANPRSNLNHHILLTQRYKPKDFANLMGIKGIVLWGTLNRILSQIENQPDGTYLIFRDPMEPTLNIYSIPPNAFDNEGEDLGTIDEE